MRQIRGEKMEYLISKDKIVEEINLIPDDKLTELYNLIHNFRIELSQSENQINEIMQFAGCWEKMSDEDFTDFCEEIEQRRQTSSSRRFTDETLFN
jgi:hypothetical protein